jgi:hypothetical protein
VAEVEQKETRQVDLEDLVAGAQEVLLQQHLEVEF